MGICNVCGRENETLVCCSACGGVCLAYCKDCLDSGAEPWDLLVAYIACSGVGPEHINGEFLKIIRNTCKRLGRTEDEFWRAVNNTV